MIQRSCSDRIAALCVRPQNPNCCQIATLLWLCCNFGLACAGVNRDHSRQNRQETRVPTRGQRRHMVRLCRNVGRRTRYRVTRQAVRRLGLEPFDRASRRRGIRQSPVDGPSTPFRIADATESVTAPPSDRRAAVGGRLGETARPRLAEPAVRFCYRHRSGVIDARPV